MANTCQKCGKSYIHRQSLCKHKRTCNEKPKSEFEKISDMSNINPKKALEDEERNEKPKSEFEKIRDMLNIKPKKTLEDEERMEVNDEKNGESSASSSNVISLKEIRFRVLLAKLSQFVHEINGNDTLKQKMLAILQKLEKNSDDNDDDDDDSDDDDDDENISFYGLITRTAQNLTKNLRENLHKLLFDMNFGYFDEKIRKMIKDFLDGKEHAESITHFLRDDLDSMKVKLIINEIDRVQRKVKEALQRLKNIHDSDVIKTLESLKFHEQITDEQFKRMAIVENDVKSFAKAMEGSGLWLAKR